MKIKGRIALRITGDIRFHGPGRPVLILTIDGAHGPSPIDAIDAPPS